MIESLTARVRNMRSRKWPICVGLLGAALFTVPAAFTPNLTLAMIYLSAAMYFVNMASGACWALATVAAPGQHSKLRRLFRALYAEYDH
jgi:hypothetical protein